MSRRGRVQVERRGLDFSRARSTFYLSLSLVSLFYAVLICYSLRLHANTHSRKNPSAALMWTSPPPPPLTTKLASLTAFRPERKVWHEENLYVIIVFIVVYETYKFLAFPAPSLISRHMDSALPFYSLPSAHSYANDVLFSFPLRHFSYRLPAYYCRERTESLEAFRRW